MLHLTINPATQTVTRLTATHDERLFFFPKKQAEVTQKPGVASRVDWFHLIPVQSHPSYPRTLHLKCTTLFPLEKDKARIQWANPLERPH